MPPLSPWERSRHSLPLESDNVLVIDTFGDIPDGILEQMKVAVRELWTLACEHRVLLIQIGPDANVWPDRQQPPRGRRL